MLLWRDVTSGYHIFCQFMRNAFLGKVRLNQGKVIFYLKVIFKKPTGGTYIYALPPGG